MIETRVGPEGYIHGWIYVGASPVVGQVVKNKKTGATGKITRISGKGVHVDWGNGPSTSHKVSQFSHPEAHEHESKSVEAENKMHEAAKAQAAAAKGSKEYNNAASAKSNAKKKAAQELSLAATAEAKHNGAEKPEPEPKPAPEAAKPAPEPMHDAPKKPSAGLSPLEQASLDYHKGKAEDAFKKMDAAGSPSMKTYYKKQAAAHQLEVAKLLSKGATASQGAPAAKPSTFAKDMPSGAPKANLGSFADLHAKHDADKKASAGKLPTDFSHMEKVAGPHGSQSGQWYKDFDGSKYYVKSSKTASNEVGAMKVYEVAGLKPGQDIPHTAMTPDGTQVVSKLIPGLDKKSQSFWETKPGDKATMKKFFAAHALTSNYDGAGMGMDNTLWNPTTGKPVMIESGGAMATKATGGKKASWGPNAIFAHEVSGVSGQGSVPNAQMKALHSGLTDADKADALQDLRDKLSAPGALSDLQLAWSKAGMSVPDQLSNMAVIKARLAQMPPIIAQLKSQGAVAATVKKGDAVADAQAALDKALADHEGLTKTEKITANAMEAADAEPGSPAHMAHQAAKQALDENAAKIVKAMTDLAAAKSAATPAPATPSDPADHGPIDGKTAKGLTAAIHAWKADTGKTYTPVKAEISMWMAKNGHGQVTAGPATFSKAVKQWKLDGGWTAPKPQINWHKKVNPFGSRRPGDGGLTPAAPGEVVKHPPGEIGQLTALNKKFYGHYMANGGHTEKISAFLEAHKDIQPAGKNQFGELKDGPKVTSRLQKDFDEAHFTPAQQAAITKYTGNSYRKMNAALREADGQETATAADLKSNKDLSSAMKPLLQDYKFYRRFGQSDTMEGIKIGDLFADAGFLSTSINRDTWAGHTVLHITAPKGTMGVWADPISSHKPEKEAILDRGTPLVVTKIEVSKNGDTHLHVTAIPHELVEGNTRTPGPTFIETKSKFGNGKMIEHRTVPIEGDGNTLHGLVTPFDVETDIGDTNRNGFKEKINAGAFTKTLQERDVVLIHNHDSALPLARTSVPDGQPGSLTLTPEPGAGLRAVAIPVQTSTGKDVLKLAKAGVIRGMSFGFEVIKDRWTDGNGNTRDKFTGTHREVLEVRLHEVTTTAFPAYPTTQLSARDRFGDTEDLLEERAASAAEPGDEEENEHTAPDGEGCSCLAAVDASLDSAMSQLKDVDRNSLPPEVNQFIDLAAGAAHLIGAHNHLAGIPDPDKPNGNTYSEPASATPDDERSDLALLAVHYRLQMEN